MNSLKVCLDRYYCLSKPADKEAIAINERIAGHAQQINQTNFREFVDKVSLDGYAFCPATFTDGERSRERFEQIQLFALDFNGSAAFQTVSSRAKRYGLPVLFAYDTYSGKDHDRFRVVFQNDIPVTDIRAAEIIQNALLTVFPEASRDSNDVTRAWYGGVSQRLYFDDKQAEITVESVARGMSAYLHDCYGVTHYKRKVAEFARDNHVALSGNGLLDISVTDNPVGLVDVPPVGTSSNGNKLPKPIILSTDDGKKLPTLSYQINLSDGGTISGYSDRRTLRTPYRSSELVAISKTCRLWDEFLSYNRVLQDCELLGLATNIIQVESGISRFKGVLANNTRRFNDEKRNFWNYNLSYLKQNDYEPWRCDRFCPYCGTCQHGRNILATAKPRPHTIERLASCEEVFYPIDEVFEDVKRKFNHAVNDGDDETCHIIKAQTAVGKTEIYLDFMANTQGLVMVAVPTNILKHDVLKRAKKMGIKVMETPSLDEIKDELPRAVWKKITSLRKSGKHRAVNPYLKMAVQSKNIRCISDYLLKLSEFEAFDGHIITTHQRLLYMSDSILRKYDAVIIDEDIIAGSILPNHIEIPVSALKKLKKKLTNTHPALAGKVKEALK